MSPRPHKSTGSRSRAQEDQEVFLCTAEVGNKTLAAEWGSKGAVNAASHSPRETPKV